MQGHSSHLTSKSPPQLKSNSLSYLLSHDKDVVMKRLALLIISFGLLSSLVGCCSTGACGRPLFGMAQPGFQQGYPAGIASSPGCGCGY